MVVKWIHVPFLLLALTLANPAHAKLLLHLPFDKDGADMVNSNRKAVPINHAVISRDSFQLGGGAAFFDGVSAVYSIPAYSPVIQNDPRSVAFWIRGSRPSTTSPNCIFLGWGGASSEARVRFDIGLEAGNDRRIRIEFNSDAAVTTTDSVNFLDGAWHHVLISFDGFLLTFFVDGKSYGETLVRTIPLQTDTSVAGLVFGSGVREALGRLGDSKRFFAGQIDDAGIWDESLDSSDAALLNGMGRIGDYDLRWLSAARKLWRGKVGSGAVINGKTWRKVGGLAGDMGDWVRAGGRDGAGSFIVLNHLGQGLQISPHWWENSAVRWAVLGLIAFAAVLLGAWSYDRMSIVVRLKRLESAQKAEAERRRISQDLHDDLGARLTEIILLGEKAREGNVASPDLKDHVNSMTDKAHSLVTALDEAVWTVNPENDFVPNVADYLSGYAQEFLQNSSIRCRLDIARDLPNEILVSKIRRNILSTVKEALNNAVRHSGASEILLRIRSEDSLLEIGIEDNGRGFDASHIEDNGNGLRNMRERIEASGGRFEITTQPGQGTKIVFRIPFRD